MRELATRDYNTMENRNSKDYVINKYIFEEHEKYFTIKYKKGKFTKYKNYLKGNLKIKPRKSKICNDYYYGKKTM